VGSLDRHIQPIEVKSIECDKTLPNQSTSFFVVVFVALQLRLFNLKNNAS